MEKSMPQAPRTVRAWPVRLVIAGIAVAAMTIVAVALITLSWYGSRAILLDMAAMAARDTGQIVAERARRIIRSEEHTSELQSRENLVCRLLLEKKKNNNNIKSTHSRQEHNEHRTE